MMSLWRKNSSVHFCRFALRYLMIYNTKISNHKHFHTAVMKELDSYSISLRFRIKSNDNYLNVILGISKIMPVTNTCTHRTGNTPYPMKRPQVLC